MKLKTGILAAVALAAVPFANAGDLLIRGGIHNVDPKSNNDLGLDVGSNATLSIGATWFLTKNIAVDLLGALPFKHDIDVAGATIAAVKHLPPTLGVQYHFNPGGSGVRPFPRWTSAPASVSRRASRSSPQASGSWPRSSAQQRSPAPSDRPAAAGCGFAAVATTR